MAPSKSAVPPPPPPPRTIPRRFQSMRPKLVAGMAAKVRAPAVQSWSGSVSAARIVERRAASPIPVVDQQANEEPPTEALAREVPPVAPRPAKPRQSRSRSTASQIAKLPKQPIRLMKSREAFHLAAQRKSAALKEPVLGGEEVQWAEVAREPPRSLPRYAGPHEELEANHGAGSDHEDLEGNHANGLDDNVNQFQPEPVDGTGRDGDGQQLTAEGTGRHATQRRPRYKSSPKISKSRVRKKKKKHGQRPHQLELATQRLTLEAEDESSDEENTQSHFRILSRPKRRRPENLRYLDESEFRMKVYDAYPSPSPGPCSDGFVGKEASPIGLVMQVRGRRSAGRSNSRGKGQKSTLRVGELVIGKNRHQDERKLKKKLEKMSFRRKRQTPSGSLSVGLEDDPIQTVTSANWEHEQEDENVFEISEQIPEHMMIVSDTGENKDHVSRIIHNKDSENDDYRSGGRLLTPSTEHTNSSRVPLIDPEHIQEENENILLVATEAPPRPDPTNPLELDEAPNEEAPSIPFLEEVTNSSDELYMVDMADDEGRDKAKTEVDIVDDEGKNEVEPDDNEVDMVVNKGRIEAETGDSKNTGVPKARTPSLTWSETYTERTDTESGSDCDASDEFSLQNSDTSSEKSNSDVEDEALSGSSEQMRGSDEEVDLETAVPRAQTLIQDPDFDAVATIIIVRNSVEDVALDDVAMTDSSEELDLDEVGVTTAVERHSSEDSDTAPEALDQQDDEIMLDAEQVAKEKTESPCGTSSELDEEPVMPIEQVLGGSTQEFRMDIYEGNNERVEDSISEEAPTSVTRVLERNEPPVVLSEETQTSPKVVPEGDGDEALLLLEDHVAAENNSLGIDNQRLRSLPLKMAGSYLEAPSDYSLDESIPVDQGVENSSAIIENSRLEELPSEIEDSYQQSQSNGLPEMSSTSILQENTFEALHMLPHPSANKASSQHAYVEGVTRHPWMPSQAGFIGNPRLGILPPEIPYSFPKSQSSDLPSAPSAFIPQKQAFVQLPPSDVDKPDVQQAYIEEKPWQPRVPDQTDSMEIYDDQIVDSPPPSYRRTASRRKSSVARTHSLTIIRARHKLGSETSTAGDFMGLSSSSCFGDQSQIIETQSSLLSSHNNELPNHRRLSARSVGKTTWSGSREAEGNLSLEEPDIHSSQLDFVQDVKSYFSRASQDLHYPVQRLITRSKSMFASSSSCLASQKPEKSSQTSYNPAPSQLISMASSGLFGRVPTLREGGEKPKLLKSLTRNSCMTHGTTRNTEKKRMVSLPFTPPFKKPEGNEGSLRR